MRQARQEYHARVAKGEIMVMTADEYVWRQVGLLSDIPLGKDVTDQEVLDRHKNMPKELRKIIMDERKKMTVAWQLHHLPKGVYEG